jgi:hypothetical protein
MIGHLVLSNAQLKVVRDLSTGKYRLMLLGGDHTTSTCFERGFPEQLQSKSVRPLMC